MRVGVGEENRRCSRKPVCQPWRACACVRAGACSCARAPHLAQPLHASAHRHCETRRSGATH
eukprot:682145-Pleurochrysis_carterae.AAC.1